MSTTHVLLVDDDPDDVELARALLDEVAEGAYHYTVAADFESGLSALATQDVDVGLVDHRLGAETGVELVRRAIATGCEAPLLLLTGVADDSVDRRALQAGASGYLAKSGLTSIRLHRAIQYAVAARRAERQRAELFRAQLAQHKAEAEAASRDRFLAMVSHELRNPLNAILGWAQVVQEMGLNSEVAPKAMRAIVRNAQLQANLVRDLIDGARVSSGTLSIEPEPLRIGDVTESATDTLGPEAERQGVTLEVVRTADDTLIRADPNRLQQALTNLLGNAVKFTPRGGTVSLDLQASDTEVAIMVRDTGKGIDPEFLPRVFDRAQKDRQSSGLGLGLWITKAIVEAHGGTISAHSDGLNQGATFCATLPLAPNLDTPSRDRRSTPRVFMKLAAVAGHRVLLVESDDDVLDYMRSTLEFHGAEVSSCTSHEIGKVLADTRFDAVLFGVDDDFTDIDPVAAALGRDSPSSTAAAAIGSDDDPAARDRWLAAGFQLYVTKPIAPRELVALVAELARPT